MKDPSQALDEFVADSRSVQERFFATQRRLILETSLVIATKLRHGGKILLFGNGGSAADAQHLAAEFIGRFGPDRPAIPALSLAVDPSGVTAIGNDYGFDKVFSRQLEALGSATDVALGISTSGNSANVVNGLRTARNRGLYTIGFTGESGGTLRDLVDALFSVPSTRTPRIQETHIVLGHVLAELVDRSLHPAAYDD